jgi:hypothetical protein
VNMTPIRNGVNARIAEARELLTTARNLDGDRPGVTAQRALANTFKGMTYVSLYAALEYCVTQTTESYLNNLSATNVRPAHLEHVIAVVALDAQLTAARMSGNTKIWPSRRAIFERLAANDPCDISDNVFGTFLHNIWPKTLDEIFQCLAINQPVTSHPSEIGYLKEIVEKRNGIAHGRTTAAESGEGLTLDEMQKRLDVTYSACLYFINTLAQHALERKFIRARYRRNYQAN